LRGSGGLEESSRRRGLCSKIGDGEQLPRGFSGPKDGFPSFLALSSRSYPVQLLREAANWCPRRPLRVLGFDPKRTKIRAPWPPIYKGFGLISKRTLLRSRFDLSIELVSALVRFNPMGKTPGVLRTRDELGRAITIGSVTTSSQLGRPVAWRAARSGVPSSRYTGYAQGRDPTSGWASEEVSAHGREEKWKGLFIF
jgi:hypothetical protein